MDLLIASAIVIGITLLGAASPGPDTALIFKNALLRSRKAGLYTALGIVTGNLVYVIVALLGLALVITQSGTAYVAVQVLGASYLMYLGVTHFLPKPIDEAVMALNEAGEYRSAYLEGLITNLLNPKFVLFLIAMFTQVIRPEWSVFAKLYLGLLIPASAGVVFVAMVFLLTHQRVRQSFVTARHIIEPIMGVALIALGAKVLFSIQK